MVTFTESFAFDSSLYITDVGRLESWELRRFTVSLAFDSSHLINGTIPVEAVTDDIIRVRSEASLNECWLD